MSQPSQPVPDVAREIDDFGRQLTRMSQIWRRAIDARVRKFGLSDATWRPLFHLGRCGGGLRQTDLAALLLIEGPTLVRALDRLERAKLVVRRADPDDRRSKILQLTPAGDEAYAKVLAEYKTASRMLLKDVPVAELHTCLQVFARIEPSLLRLTDSEDSP